MIPHCTAAALVSENKGLCHPSSVDSLSTSAGQEDHVSMGGWSARKVGFKAKRLVNLLLKILFLFSGVDSGRKCGVCHCNRVALCLSRN